MFPLFPWLGSKRFLGFYVKPLNNTLELFSGAASLSFMSEPTHAWLNDVNPYMMNFYKHVQQYGSALYGVSVVDFDRDVDVKYFKQIEREYNEHIDEMNIDNAARFLFIIKYASLAVWRVNSKGEINSSFKHRKHIKMPDLDEARRLMKSWTLTCSDFRGVKPHPNSLLIVDPPYVGSDAKYTFPKWKIKDILDLKQYLNDVPNDFVLFEYYNDHILNAFNCYTIYTLQRKMPLYSKKNKPEIIATRGVKIDDIFDVDLLTKKYNLKKVK